MGGGRAGRWTVRQKGRQAGPMVVGLAERAAKGGGGGRLSDYFWWMDASCFDPRRERQGSAGASDRVT